MKMLIIASRVISAKSILFLLVLIILNVNCNIQEQSNRYPLLIENCSDCQLEIIDNGVQIDHSTQLDQGSVEESISQLYLHYNFEDYKYNYGADKEYYFLGIERENFDCLRGKLKLRLVFKFFYDVEDVRHCLTRFLITNEYGDEMMYHSRLIFNNNRWKVGDSRMDRYYSIRLMLGFKIDHIYDVLVQRKSKEPVLQEAIKLSVNPASNRFNFETISKYLIKHDKEVTQYKFKTKKHFSIPWLKKCM